MLGEEENAQFNWLHWCQKEEIVLYFGQFAFLIFIDD